MNSKTSSVKLDEYESGILKAFENNEFKVSNKPENHRRIARNTIKNNRLINIRIAENDLVSLQRSAAREGLSYQIFIGSVLHKFASGYYKEAFQR